MGLGTLVETYVTPQEQTGISARLKLSGGESKRVLVADFDVQYHPFYRALEEIVGRGNVDIFSTIHEALRSIRTQHYSAYVIDPFMSIHDRNDWGMDLIESIRRKENAYNPIWLLSDHHDLLKDAENKGVKHL